MTLILMSLINSVFGRWTVIEELPSDKKHNYCLCKCACGTIRKVQTAGLKSGGSLSCGCLAAEVAKDMMTKHGQSKIRTRAYRSWEGMLGRCSNQSDPAWKDYGGRGITVCERWLQFENFFEDMGAPAKGQTIDRVDNNGAYCKENCRWATKTEQARNRRNNDLITYKDKTLCLSEWAQVLGIHRATLASRLANGWTVESAFTVDPYSYHNKGSTP